MKVGVLVIYCIWINFIFSFWFEVEKVDGFLQIEKVSEMFRLVYVNESRGNFVGWT